MNAGSSATLLEEINSGLPKDVDWKAGAVAYVANASKTLTSEGVEQYAKTKPMYFIGSGENYLRALEEATRYLSNFTNLLDLLRLPAGSRFMDVACGAGWLSHYLRRYGYETFGIDIAPDFIALAKKRLYEDPYLQIAPEQTEAMFAVVDIETQSLGPNHVEKYDAIVLESCFHHFFDPLSALRNLASCLKPDGVVVIIEGENRTGPIREDYMAVMREYATIERPYSRDQLVAIMTACGLPEYEFVGQINGFFSPRDPIWGDATSRLRETEAAMNLAVAAKSSVAIERIFPFRADAKVD